MKKLFTISLLFFATIVALAQNTATLSIENPMVVGSKFSFEIHITPTSAWVPALQIGNSTWAFDYNSSALANPVLSFIDATVTGTQYSSTVVLSGSKILVTTFNDNSVFAAVLTNGVKQHVYTVELDITNAALESDIAWGELDTGVFTIFDSQIVETYIQGGDIPLPVELSSFKVNSVEGTKAQLNWETATEINNYGFEIERSVVVEESEEEAVWEKVAFVEGHGNSNSTKVYSFTDKNLVGGSKFLYRLKQIDIDGTFEYTDAVEVEVLPTKYELFQNYPNPFNPTTNIKFSLPEDTKLAINIYNLLGEKVATILNEELKAGFHQVDFNTYSAGYTLASGVYIYTIESKNFTSVKKMILMK